MTVIPIVNGVLGTFLKEMERRLESLQTGGRIKTIKSTALLILAKILRRVLENSSEKPTRMLVSKISHNNNNNNNNNNNLLLLSLLLLLLLLLVVVVVVVVVAVVVVHSLPMKNERRYLLYHLSILYSFLSLKSPQSRLLA